MRYLKVKKVISIGRLVEYKYYDMHQKVEHALDKVDAIHE